MLAARVPAQQHDADLQAALRAIIENDLAAVPLDNALSHREANRRRPCCDCATYQLDNKGGKRHRGIRRDAGSASLMATTNAVSSQDNSISADFPYFAALSIKLLKARLRSRTTPVRSVRRPGIADFDALISVIIRDGEKNARQIKTGGFLGSRIVSKKNEGFVDIFCISSTSLNRRACCSCLR